MGYYWYYVPVKENCMRKLSPITDWQVGFLGYRYVILLWNGRTVWRRHILTGFYFTANPAIDYCLVTIAYSIVELPVLQFTHEIYHTVVPYHTVVY